MALEKTKQDIYGNGGISYWKISKINIDYINNNSVVILNGYLSKDARDNGKCSLDSSEFRWSGNDFIFDEESLKTNGTSVRTLAYQKIKQSVLDEDGNETNFFVNAKDV